MMDRRWVILLAVVCCWCFLPPRLEAGELSTWEQILATATRYQGPVWCGTIDGTLQISKKLYTVFGYQLVSPDRQEVVVHLYQPFRVNDALASTSRLLRVMISKRQGWLQVGAETPRQFFPSETVVQGIRMGLAFGLPRALTHSPRDENGIRISTEGTELLQITMPHATQILPGLEGQVRILVDRRTGAPRQLVAFGLDEWLGVPREGYKLLLTFQSFPGCRRPK